ncbi:hypothetical protein Tco_0299748 [Tanacetum coccineum]
MVIPLDSQYLARRNVFIRDLVALGSSEGSGITPEVPDDPKDNSAVVAEKQAGYVLTNLTLSSAELEIQSMMDVSIHQEDLAVQRTPLIDLVILMVTEKTASTPTPTTTQAHVQMCSTSCWKDISKRSLEVLVGARKTETDKRLLQRTEIPLKRNLPDHRSVLTDSEDQAKMEMEIPRSSGVNSPPNAHT